MEETKVKKPRAAKATAPTPTLRPALEKKEDGSVNWRKIVDPQNIYLNFNFFARKGIDIKTLEQEEIEKYKNSVEDDGLVISLAGIRQLANARGVKSVIYDLVDRTDERAAIKCTMILVPNADEPYEVTICGISNASVLNTTPDYFAHAEAIGSNRAYCRCVRNYLNIVSVSNEEMNPLEKKEEVATSSPVPQQTLRNQMEELGIEISDLVKIIEERGYSFGKKLKGDLGYEPWDQNLFSLSGPACFSLITDIKNYKK